MLVGLGGVVELLVVQSSKFDTGQRQQLLIAWHVVKRFRQASIIADGRNHVFLTDKKYDLIVSVPSNPWMAGISNLFTEEFFDQCLDRLTDDGVMCQWIHTYNMAFEDFMMVVKTFMSSMPEATLWETVQGDYLMVGSKKKIEIDWDELDKAIGTPRVNKHLATGTLNDIRWVLTDFISTKDDLQQMEEFKSAQINVDDSCKLEFSAPRAYYERGLQAQDDQIAGLRRSPKTIFSGDGLANLDAETIAWLENVPRARALYIDSIGMSQDGDLAASMAALKKAVKMNPYDPRPRRQILIGCLYFARTADAMGDYERAAALTREAVKHYEAAEICINNYQAAVLYFMCKRAAERVGDEDTVARGSAKLDKVDIPEAELEQVASRDFERLFR